MKDRTMWRRMKPAPLDCKKAFYHEDIGWFHLSKAQFCMSRVRGTPHWERLERAIIKTRDGRKYAVPFKWIRQNCKNENGCYVGWVK